MPFIDIQRPVQDLSNLAIDETPDIDPTTAETWGAAFRTQNVVGSFLTSRGMPNPYEIEQDFNAIDYVKDDPKYGDYVDRFAGVFNRKAADALKARIDKEDADRRTLDAAGGMGFLAQMAAGVIDLPTLLPIGGGAVSGARGLGLAGRVALAAGIDAGVSEAALQGTQVTRTGTESAINIGGSILLGGALGALASRYLNTVSSKALSSKIERQAAEFADIDRGFAQAQSAGAAARDTGPLELKDEWLISKLPIVNRQDPLIRLQLGELDAGRQTVRQMAETPLEYAENAAGVATERGGAVETRMKMWNAPLADTLDNIDTQFARYYHSTPEPGSWQRRLSPTLSEWNSRRGDSRMTFKQFKEEVGRAAYMGGEHSIPEVKAAAAAYRNLDETLKKAAIDARLFPEDVSVAGDISHRFRMYNKEKIVAERGRFGDILEDYFVNAQQSAQLRAQEMQIGRQILKADELDARYNQAFERLEGIERRLDGRDEARRRRLGSIDEARQLRFDVMRRRAPEPLVKALRGADQNAAMVDVVKESRQAARTADKKQSYAERYPILAEIRNRGGVRVGSKLDQELRAMDITPKTHPGLFIKDKGLGDIDNIPYSESPYFVNLPDDGTGNYVDPRALMQAIRDEAGGNPLRTEEQIAAAELADNLDRVASEWLDDVGLPPNATVKDVRDHIARVIGAEKDVYALDAKISGLERSLEEFDTSTDGIRLERDVSAQEAKTIADELDALERGLDDVQEIANSSPRVRMMVDYGRAKRDLFKAKLQERNLRKRVDALKKIEADGRATDEMRMELEAGRIDLERLDSKIGKLIGKVDTLEKSAPKIADLESTEEFANLSKGEIRSLVDETINTILGHAEGRIPYDIVAGPRGPLKERLLKIETAKIHDFVQNDIEEVLRAQIRTMAPDIELSKKFGSVDLKEEIRKINDEADAKIAKAETKEQRQRLEKARTDAIRDVEGIRDRLRGTYRLPADPSSLILRGARVARNLNYVRLLGGMTISAVPDLGKIVFTHGMTSTFRDGFLPLVKNLKAFRAAAKEVKAAGTALDMILDSRTMAMADIVDEFGHKSKFERGLSALSTKFGVVSLMAPWNATLKQFSGMLTMTNLLRAAEKAAKGTASADEVRRLASSGIDADLAARITQQFAEHGEGADGVFLPHGDNWTDKEALEAFRAAVVRDVDRTIVTPGQDKPLWMSTELGKVIGQFKSFAVSSMQRTMLAGLQQRDAAVLNGAMVMMALGAVAYAMKQQIAGQPLSDNPATWAVEAFDRSGLTGWLMEANNIAEKASRGRVGFSALTGEQVSRYATRNVTGAFLGPSADAVADIFQVSGSVFARDMTQSDLRKARQLVPFQNLFFLRGLFNQVEQATGAALDLPETRRN